MTIRTKFLNQAGLDARRTYIQQAEARQSDPEGNPSPDLSLLLVGSVFGPFTHVELATIEGEAQVAVSIHGRNLRYFDPSDYVALSLGLGFRGGLSFNDTGGDLGYPRTRATKPEGRAIHILRVLTDAQPWQVAEQRTINGVRVDYHWLSRRYLSLRSVRRVWAEGKQSRVPWLGRQAFYDAAAQRWTANHVAAGLAISLADYLDLIQRALTLGDWHYAQLNTAKKAAE